MSLSTHHVLLNLMVLASLGQTFFLQKLWKFTFYRKQCLKVKLCHGVPTKLCVLNMFYQIWWFWHLLGKSSFYKDYGTSFFVQTNIYKSKLISLSTHPCLAKFDRTLITICLNQCLKVKLCHWVLTIFCQIGWF